MEIVIPTTVELEAVMQDAWRAFQVYRNTSLVKRAELMKAIAAGLGASGDELIQVAMRETNLTEARLKGERARTIFQLDSYADACMRGDWLEARIDTAVIAKTPPKPDIRKMMVPLGPVVVFGASNFPFAYSTAGGDTACALAAGCPVIVKAHPAHQETSDKVASIIREAVKNAGLPSGVFSHVHSEGHDTGQFLVTHPYTKAVGFTGSLTGGRQLFDWGNQRKDPIHVFAEMGSINPVFLLPEKLSVEAKEVAILYASSITLGTGQFCTNPGLIIGVKSEGLDTFKAELGRAIQESVPAPMLHPGIFKNYVENRANALSQEQVEVVAVAEAPPQLNEGAPTIASVKGEIFLKNPVLHQEVFGPYSLIVECADQTEMLNVAKQMEGQLTATLMGTVQDIKYHSILVDTIKNFCGRIIINNVPTGVEVCASMHHGGPYPATTDSRFTSVGEDGIKRFARPVCFQNWPHDLLPDELKDENSLGLWRKVDGVMGEW